MAGIHIEISGIEMDKINKFIRRVKYFILSGCPNCYNSNWDRITCWYDPPMLPSYPDIPRRSCLDCGHYWREKEE